MFRPIAPVLGLALTRLDPVPSFVPAVVPGAPGGPLVWVGPDGIALDPALVLEGAMHPVDLAWAARVPPELRPLALDRWRRAAAAVLEGIASLAIPEDAAAPAWWRAARAAEAADRATPELGLLWPALADWLAEPEAGAHDAHRGAWFVRFCRRTGTTDLHDDAWLAFGRWLFDPVSGPASQAPAVLNASLHAPGRWRAASHSFRRVRVEAGPAGASLALEGAIAGRTVRLAAAQHEVVLVGAVEAADAAARVEPAGPVGTWTVVAARSRGPYHSVRGVEVTLRADASGEVTLADAFVGPMASRAGGLADRFGVSGVLRGTWRVTGFAEDGADVELGAITLHGVTAHARGKQRFALPIGAVMGRVEEWIAKVGGTRWRVRATSDGIEVEGGDLGMPIAVMLAPAPG